jgi:hypothetical protein
LSLLFFSTGCQILGAAASKLSPPPTIKAQYAPEKQPTLVLVENYHNPASLQMESEAVARHLTEELRMHNVAPLVDAVQAEELRHEKGVGAYRKMSLDAIGQAVGAKQIIYVDLESFQIDHAAASEFLDGSAEARVRVVDAGTGQPLWPTDSAGGVPVSVTIQPQRVAPGGGGDYAVRQQLHATLADKVAKLFYDWQSESSDGAEEQF